MPTRKILHAADIHLDSPLQKLGAYEHAPVDRIRGASRRALENMVRLAIDQSVDLVVIAGDLYDGDWHDQNTGLFFVKQANKLVEAGIPLAIIRGNHDAANVMTSSLRLPKNPDGSEIMLCSDRVDLRQFESIGVAVHGRSFRCRAETENMAAEYPDPISGMFNLGLLHTSLTGAEGHDPYAPCTPSQLADKDYDYWALGHVHARGEHGLEGSAPIAFSGNIQGRHIRETGPKGCLIIDVDQRNRCASRLHELDVVRWELCRIDVSNTEIVDEVIDEFQHWMNRSLADLDDRLLVTRVELVGQTPINHTLRRKRDYLRGSLQAVAASHGHGQVWLEDLKIRTTLPDHAFSAAELEGPLESLAAVVNQLRSDPGASETIEHELRDLLRKLPKESHVVEATLPVDDPQWIQDMIESASSEVLTRVQGSSADAD